MNIDRALSWRTDDLVPVHPLLVTRATGRCTILNDDYYTPAGLKMFNGEHATITFDAGRPFDVDTTIPLGTTVPSVISVPASIMIPAGRHSGTIEVTALAAGTASITAQLPASYRGVLATARVEVVDRVGIVAKPSTLNLHAGDNATVTLSIMPASAMTKFLTIASSDDTLVQAPDSATITPGGSADVAVHALRTGGGSILVTDPSSGVVTSIPVDVVSATAPAIDAIVPNVGPASGGTPVTLVGAHFETPCAVSFGTVGGTSVNAHGDTLSAITPAHTEGTVDVVVTCGSDQVTLPNAFTFGHSRRRSARP